MSGQRIRILSPSGPTHYFGREMKPKRKPQDVTPFDSDRGLRKAVSVLRRQMKPGETLEAGYFAAEVCSAEQPWTPFEPAAMVGMNPILEDKIGKPHAVWVNSRYQVLVYDAMTAEGWPPMWHLSIKRIDKEPIRDWRELQRIKNELVGPEHDGMELFPSEGRLVDTANQYHLFVLKEKGRVIPVGWMTRLVHEGELENAKQRPFEKEARDVAVGAEAPGAA